MGQKKNPHRLEMTFQEKNMHYSFLFSLFLAFSSLMLNKQFIQASLADDSLLNDLQGNMSTQELSPHVIKACQLKKHSNEDFLAYLEIEEVQNDPQIQTLIGYLFFAGTNIFELSYSKAAVWFEKAAISGHAQAQSLLSVLYFNGKGVEKNEKKGMFWLNKAIVQNNPWAFQILGEKYFHGEGVVQDYAKAFELFTKGADLGDPCAQHSLAFMYAQGKAIKEDFSKALFFLKKAADGGVSKAQYSLGVMYLNGELERNLALGTSYIELAAAQGLCNAQYTLGEIYKDNGNLEKACLWFEKAAAQGNKAARTELKSLKYSYLRR